MTRFRSRFAAPRRGGSCGLWSFLLLGLFGCAPAAGKGESAEQISPREEDKETPPDVSPGHGDDGDSETESGDPIFVDAGGGTGGAENSSHCLTFMSWGAVAVQGAVPGESGRDAIVSWLDDASSAEGEHFLEKPEITPEFLARYDLVLLQNLGAWEITEGEVQAFQDWVRAGGGVMSLSGYEGDAEQVIVTNRLLSFTGINYANMSEAGDTSITLGVCGYCLGSTSRQEGWSAEHPISEGISAVGAFAGRSIHGEGAIVAQEEGKVLGMTQEIDSGRVFLFHDDWISYHGVWSQGAPSECTQNSECKDASPREAYQVPRLWRNAFNWLAPGRECFHVEGVDVLEPE